MIATAGLRKELRKVKRMRSIITRSMSRGVVALLFAVFGLTSAFPAPAASLSRPTDKPILTVTGKITVTNDGGNAVFDRAMIEALGATSFSTSTPWYDGSHKFEGALLAKLLDTVGSAGDRLIVTALNDYVTEIPVADARKFGVILALKRDGQYMPVSDKGPIFIIYPFDSNSELKAQVYYKRSAWQVSRIEVK
jgi:hypothetical protein